MILECFLSADQGSIFSGILIVVHRACLLIPCYQYFPRVKQRPILLDTCVIRRVARVKLNALSDCFRTRAPDFIFKVYFWILSHDCIWPQDSGSLKLIDLLIDGLLSQAKKFYLLNLNITFPIAYLHCSFWVYLLKSDGYLLLKENVQILHLLATEMYSKCIW